MNGPTPFQAVLFDLLSALIDSWSLWDGLAGGEEAGRRWRMRYLELTYASRGYRPYLALVAEAARDVGLSPSLAEALDRSWDELEPWPEAAAVVEGLADRVPVGVVTNCSAVLGHRAAARVGKRFRVVVTAEEVGWYKPDPRVYRTGLDALGTDPGRTLFVAGSPFDVPGAAKAGMPVVWHDRVGILNDTAASLALRVLPDLHDLPALVDSSCP